MVELFPICAIRTISALQYIGYSLIITQCRREVGAVAGFFDSLPPPRGGREFPNL